MTVREDMKVSIGEQREQCEQHFMTTGAYWKSVVLGTIAIVGIAGGVFAWGMGVTATEAKHSERIRENREHITAIEKSLNGKLDRILRSVERR